MQRLSYVEITNGNLAQVRGEKLEPKATLRHEKVLDMEYMTEEQYNAA